MNDLEDDTDGCAEFAGIAGAAGCQEIFPERIGKRYDEHRGCGIGSLR